MQKTNHVFSNELLVFVFTPPFYTTVAYCNLSVLV